MKIIRTLPFYKGVTKKLTSPQRNGNQCLTYTEGLTLTADGIDLDPDKDCGQGINFCRSIAEALRWGPVVVEIRVPDKTPIVDMGGKLRAKKVVVGPVISLSRADLSRADLSRAYLYGAYLYGAYLSGADLSRAYLSGADLSGADLSGANLTGTRGDSGTILPDGYTLTEAGLVVRK